MKKEIDPKCSKCENRFICMVECKISRLNSLKVFIKYSKISTKREKTAARKKLVKLITNGNYLPSSFEVMCDKQVSYKEREDAGTTFANYLVTYSDPIFFTALQRRLKALDVDIGLLCEIDRDINKQGD